MNLVKGIWLLAVLCSLLTACGADSPTAPADPPENPPEETADEPVPGVIHTFGNTAQILKKNETTVVV